MDHPQISFQVRRDSSETLAAMAKRVGEALERVERHGDLFEPVLAGGQALGRALRKLPE